MQKTRERDRKEKPSRLGTPRIIARDSPLEHAVLIVPVKAAGAAAGRNFCLQVQEIVPLFPLCKGNPIKFYGAYWLLQAFVSPVKSSEDTGGVTLSVCVCVSGCTEACACEI